MMTDKRVNKAIKLMTTDLKRPLTLSETARRVSLSVSHLSYLFRSEIGQSPARFVMTARMNRAAELLLNSNFSVKEIMDAVGFADKSDFNRTFKRFFGRSPTAYREQSLTELNRKND